MPDKWKEYRKEYIKKMRETIGHAPLMVTGCGVIIENKEGKILLQHRKDNQRWGLPGGAMELGEKFEEAARREVREETGLKIGKLSLIGIFSGEDRILTYPNGDVCCYTGIQFYTKEYEGTLLQETVETLGHKFFGKEELPENINPYDKKMLQKWMEWDGTVFVD